jgi:DNA-binding Lrp family transcriptional regulator
MMDQRSNKLLKLLERDCTLSHAQLAAMCDTTEEDIANQIQELTEAGILLGYKAVVNWEPTAVENVEALIEVQVTPQRDKGFDRIAERIYQYEEVESCYLMSGGYDLTVILTGRTLREVALFVSQKLSTIEGVNSTATHFILKKYKQQDVIFAPKEAQKERLIFV